MKGPETTLIVRFGVVDSKYMDVFVARQPIFDRRRQVHAYELLFRADAIRNEYNGMDAGAATSQVIANSLLAIGLDTILNGRKAFLNFGRSLLLADGWRSLLPKEIAVIEILETVEPDPEVIEACQALRRNGYTIALDDFVYDPRFEPLTQIANLIKVDVQQTSQEEQQRLVRTYKARGLEMLAEKVETYEEFQWARSIGYDYFQGYFFARPVIVKGRQIPSSTRVCLQLLREAQSPNLDFHRLEALISGDVSLSYKLLRYVNSALYMRARETSSIGEAVVRVGETGMRRWIMVAVLPLMAANKSLELALLSLVRAHFCESVARMAGIQKTESAFLIGLFSLLDALIDRSLDEALREVALAPEIANVLLGLTPETDSFTVLYRLARCYEVGDWDTVEELSQRMGVPARCVGEAYLDATRQGAEAWPELKH